MLKIVSVVLIALLGALPTTQAQEPVPTDSAPLTNFTPEETDWVTTKPDPNAEGVVELTTSGLTPDEKIVEIINESSLSTTRSYPPLASGKLEFKAKHNQVGLFYIYALTADNGGQLLFSLQFTEDRGLLLEQSDQQITLLDDYVENEWYEFTIDFDNTRGDHGMFTVAMNGQTYGDYEYVNSESDTFELAQITIGSESTDATAVSGFIDSSSPLPGEATSTASDALLLLSISLSSTSISSDLDNGLIVTATLDGIPNVATSSARATDTASSSNISTTTDDNEGSSLGSFIMDIVETVIDIFTPEEAAPEETSPEPTDLEPTLIESPDEISTTTEATTPVIEPVSTEPQTVEPIPELPPAADGAVEPVSDNEVQSSLSTDESTTNEVITATF